MTNAGSLWRDTFAMLGDPIDEFFGCQRQLGSHLGLNLRKPFKRFNQVVDSNEATACGHAQTFHAQLLAEPLLPILQVLMHPTENFFILLVRHYFSFLRRGGLLHLNAHPVRIFDNELTADGRPTSWAVVFQAIGHHAPGYNPIGGGLSLLSRRNCEDENPADGQIPKLRSFSEH